MAMQLTHLGPYEIGKPLGKGGMGSVYEARNIDTGERVAVKALSPHLATAEGFRERFEAEIESLKALRHDGIVRLYGYGEQDGVLFYSMELVDGTSLDDELKAGRRFNWREVTNIAIQLSLALKHAHDHGIVHRDIKPANILMVNDEKVKLADFGIARLFGTNQLTTAGGVLGTADYMSPEQADGRPVTARCDQYSLGGVMYALLAGRPPFRATNLPQMLQLQRFAKPEPVRAFAPDTPEQLDRVIAQLLAKEPAERFPNMQVLSRHLQALAMALSRPMADGFALAGDELSDDRLGADWNHSISIEVTQAEADVQPRGRSAPVVSKPEAGGVAGNVSPEDAATLAADDVRRTEGGQAAVTSGAKPPLGKLGTGPAVVAAAPPKAPDRPARFTTVEEEEARRAAQHQRSWLLLAGQLAVFAAVLAGLGGAAWYLSRPRSADAIYQAVVSRTNAKNADSLVNASSDIDEFVERYPADPRADKMRGYQDQIALDRAERKLQRTAEGSTDPSLLPIEQNYLRAMSMTEESPEQAAAMLQALLDLHPAGAALVGEKDADERTAAIVHLARRRLKKLRAEIGSQAKRESEAFAERMKAAEQLANTDPKTAARMFRAMIELYGEKPWASNRVETARARLAELEEQE
ncbi:MAG: serine/threonine-protein kinase [Pirellulales bacterium]